MNILLSSPNVPPIIFNSILKSGSVDFTHGSFVSNVHNMILMCVIVGHINNLYNTCFWSLVGAGVSNSDAEKQIKVLTYLVIHTSEA